MPTVARVVATIVLAGACSSASDAGPDRPGAQSAGAGGSGPGACTAPACAACADCVSACTCQGIPRADCDVACGEPGGAGSGGAGPGAGGTGSAAGAGASAVDAGPSVAFDWPETPPGTGECRPGRYEGTFQCTYVDASGTYSMPVTGPMGLTLEPSATGEILTVKDGLLDGTANVAFTIRAEISGQLACAASSFQGTLVNGTYSGFAIINGTFHGVLASSYDRAVASFTAGTWTLTPDQAGGTCAGTWTAKRVGP